MQLAITPEDDPEFVAPVNAILTAVIAECGPRLAVVTQIDNWFDHKWLDFSGKVAGVVGSWSRDLTVPPFHPNRVKHQVAYQRHDDGSYSEVEAPQLHRCQESSQNLNRKLRHQADPGVFAWWSSNTKVNGRGSLMVYTHIENATSSWFASFERRAEWCVRQARQISIEEVQALLERGATGSSVDPG